VCVYQAHCLTEQVHGIDLLSLDPPSVAEVGFVPFTGTAAGFRHQLNNDDLGPRKIYTSLFTIEMVAQFI